MKCLLLERDFINDRTQIVRKNYYYNLKEIVLTLEKDHLLLLVVISGLYGRPDVSGLTYIFGNEVSTNIAMGLICVFGPVGMHK